MDTPHIQPSLLRPEAFQPIGDGQLAYVPVLQSFRGELDALSTADAEVRSRIVPVIAIVGPKNVGKEPLRRDRVRNWVKRAGDAIGTQPFFLDRVRLNPLHPVVGSGGKAPVLTRIGEAAGKRGLIFVPVLRMEDGVRTRKLVSNIALENGRGLALRYRMLGSVSSSAEPLPGLMEKRLEELSLSPGAVDLLLDLEFLSEDVDVSAVALVENIDELSAVGDWRNVVLIGTSMPKSLGGGVVMEGTVGRLPRREWNLWQEIRNLAPRRIPTFGDYAIQNPDPPAMDGGGGPGLRANIRYTLSDVTVVPRGHGSVVVMGAEQYRELCRQIVGTEGFSGATYSWGDMKIAECAEGGETGSQALWRGAGTSHHLRFVVDQIAGLN